MRKLYNNQIIDYNEGQTEFVEEFNEQITYGAIVYNHDYNSYQYITSFEQIDFKKEVLPDYFKVMIFFEFRCLKLLNMIKFNSIKRREYASFRKK